MPCVDLRRGLKKAQENYWAWNISQQQLLETSRELWVLHWQQQKVGNFALYDHILTTSLMLDNVPDHHRSGANASDNTPSWICCVPR